MGEHSIDVPEWYAVPAPGEELIPKATPVIKATPADVGVWVDGARGIYAGTHAVHIAVSRGWPITAEDQADVDAWNAGDSEPGERISEIVDDVTTWLTDNVAPDGHVFEWCDGDLMLWTDAQSCAASGDRCYCVEPHRPNGEPLASRTVSAV